MTNMAWESFTIYKNIIINHYHKLHTTRQNSESSQRKTVKDQGPNLQMSYDLS